MRLTFPFVAMIGGLIPLLVLTSCEKKAPPPVYATAAVMDACRHKGTFGSDAKGYAGQRALLYSNDISVWCLRNAGYVPSPSDACQFYPLVDEDGRNRSLSILTPECWIKGVDRRNLPNMEDVGS